MNKEDEAELKRRLDILWRGAYGDEDNEIPGFVDEIKELKKLEEKRTNRLQKAIYVGAGSIGTLQFVFWLIEKLHIKLF